MTTSNGSIEAMWRVSSQKRVDMVIIASGDDGASFESKPFPLSSSACLHNK